MIVTARVLVVLLGLVTLLGAHAESAPPEEIRVASEVWEDHTNADGSGMAWDLLRAVFEPAGVILRLHSEPYTRSVGLVQRGEMDAWVGSYRDEVLTKVYYPHWHYDADRVSALGLRDKPAPSLARLGDLRLVWMRGYAFQRYLPNVRDFREIHGRSGILAMLDYGHADFFIDARDEVIDVLAGASDRERYQVVDLTSLPLYLGFADTPRARKLADLYDRRMAQLVKSGALRPIYRRWQQPYPFD